MKTRLKKKSVSAVKNVELKIQKLTFPGKESCATGRLQQKEARI